MAKERKVSKTYRYDSDVVAHAEKNPLISSFANWACDKYRQEFLSLETKTAQLEEACKLVENLEADIATVREKEKETLNMLKDHEISWLKTEAPRRLKTASFEGVYQFFVRTYKHNEITRRQFKLLVEKYRDEKE